MSAAALSNLARGSIIRPGAALTRAAQLTLADPKRADGEYPFQWLYPGPNSRIALPNGSVAIPAIATPGTPVTATILSYTVPEGYRLSLRALTMNAFASDWQRGSGQLTFTLQVKFSTGPRNVEFLASTNIGLGTDEKPFPLEGRLEFQPLDVLVVMVTNNSISTPDTADYAYAVLDGFTYPNAESA